MAPLAEQENRAEVAITISSQNLQNQANLSLPQSVAPLAPIKVNKKTPRSHTTPAPLTQARLSVFALAQGVFVPQTASRGILPSSSFSKTTVTQACVRSTERLRLRKETF